MKTAYLPFAEVTEQERVAVRDVILTSYQQYEEVFAAERWQRYVKELKAAVDHKDTDIFIIAKVAEQIIGTMQLFCTAKEAYHEATLQIEHPIIRFLAVHPQARGLGVAKRLLDQAVVYAKHQKATAISLHTTEMMTDAVRLYENYGFQRNECYDYVKRGSNIQGYTFII